MAVKPQKGVRSVEEFKTQLHRHGLKATRPRIAVHTVMMDLVHASPDQVVERFREAGVKVTVASVYNILSELSDNHIMPAGSPPPARCSLTPSRSRTSTSTTVKTTLTGMLWMRNYRP